MRWNLRSGSASRSRRLTRSSIPRTGRGVERTVPPQAAERILRERGSGYSPTVLRVLAALLASPMGLGSIRSIAAVAGVSPTSVGKLLPSLLDTGLVRHREQREIMSGRVTTGQRFTLDLRSPSWAEVAEAVRATPLPERAPERAVRVPQPFWHLFWNATPASLRIDRDGTYIARRMLNTGGAAAAQWALEHIDAPDLLAAVRGRGSDERTRAMVENWLAAWARKGA
jgi:DNA-binding transcriptional ArsR family regulator